MTLVVLVVEFGVPWALDAWAQPSLLRMVLTLGVLLALWSGARVVVVLTLLYWGFLAVTTAVLHLHDGTLPAATGMAIGTVYGLLAFILLVSENLHAFFRHRREAFQDKIGETEPGIQPSEPRAARAGEASRISLPIVAPAPLAPGAVPDSSAGGVWPVCPGCGVRRMTRCPICHTAGSDFRPADRGFSGTNDLLVLCPTCDEPFAPQHARHCEWCGHEFAEGFEPEPRSSEYEPADWRVMLALGALVVLLGGMAAYVKFLF